MYCYDKALARSLNTSCKIIGVMVTVNNKALARSLNTGLLISNAFMYVPNTHLRIRIDITTAYGIVI